jgi:hypothetical protein
VTRDDPTAGVPIYRGPDELQAELIRAALESAGVTVRVYGLRRGAIIGAGEQLSDVRVVVPATQRVRAERVLDDLAEAAACAGMVTEDDLAAAALAAGPHEAASGEAASGEAAVGDAASGEAAGGHAADHAVERSALRPRRRLFAVVATLIAPGLGQIYGQLVTSGSLLLAGTLVTLPRAYLGMTAGDVTAGRAFVAVLACGWVLDQVIAQRAIGARRVGRPRPDTRTQLALGALQAAVLVALNGMLLR